jgi:hypothetical protein
VLRLLNPDTHLVWCNHIPITMTHVSSHSLAHLHGLVDTTSLLPNDWFKWQVPFWKKRRYHWLSLFVLSWLNNLYGAMIIWWTMKIQHVALAWLWVKIAATQVNVKPRGARSTVCIPWTRLSRWTKPQTHSLNYSILEISTDRGHDTTSIDQRNLAWAQHVTKAV